MKPDQLSTPNIMDVEQYQEYRQKKAARETALPDKIKPDDRIEIALLFPESAMEAALRMRRSGHIAVTDTVDRACLAVCRGLVSRGGDGMYEVGGFTVRLRGQNPEGVCSCGFDTSKRFFCWHYLAALLQAVVDEKKEVA